MGTLIGIGNTVYHGGVGVGSLTPVAAFIANFISGSATPTKGSATYTYTRALTTQTITDFEGLVKSTLAEEIGFHGQRRAENLFTDATNSLAISATTTDVTLALGTYVYSMGAGTGIATFSGTAVGEPSPLTSNASNRTSVAFTITTAGSFIVTASVAALVDFMLEDITGQIENGTEEAPSEFVSVGVGDDHGSNVDGVKYFPTENGNTVTSNVVTEATGATIAIPDPNQGVQIWEARTNYQLNNEDITSASYGVSVMTAEVDPTQFVTGKSIDWTFLEALGSAYHFVTLAASEDTGEFSAEGRRSFFVRARGRTYITLYDFGALECSFFIGVGQGTKDTNVAFTLDANITDYGNDIFRIDFEVITPPSGNSKMRSVDVYLSNSPGEPYGVGGNAYAGDDELGIELAGSMAELGAFVSPYIPTAGAAATRNADDLQYDPANYVETGFALLDFFVTADQLANHATSPTIFTIAKTAFGDYVTAYINDATTVTIDFVTAAGGGASTADFTVAAGNQYKIAFTWDKVTGTIRASLDGAAAFDFTGAAAADILATADADTFEIGMYNATQLFNGNILAVQFGNSLMEDADLEALST